MREDGRVVMADVSSFRKLTNQVHLVVVNIWSDPRGFESHSSQQFLLLVFVKKFLSCRVDEVYRLRVLPWLISPSPLSYLVFLSTAPTVTLYVQRYKKHRYRVIGTFP